MSDKIVQNMQKAKDAKLLEKYEFSTIFNAALASPLALLIINFTTSSS